MTFQRYEMDYDGLYKDDEGDWVEWEPMQNEITKLRNVLAELVATADAAGPGAFPGPGYRWHDAWQAARRALEETRYKCNVCRSEGFEPTERGCTFCDNPQYRE